MTTPDAEVPWTGGCLCGEVRWRSTAPPVFQFNCHCIDCRKSTGAAMLPLMFFPAQALRIDGPLVSFASRGGSGGRIRRDFCGRCGAQVTAHVDMVPALQSIRAASRAPSRESATDRFVKNMAGTAGRQIGNMIIRGILGVDAETGAVTVGDDVPVGAVVRLHLRDADSAEADLVSVVRLAHDSTDPVGAYVFTCNGRGGAMFTTSDHDGAIIREGLGTRAVGGFFAAGEIGPVGGANHLHGFTAVVLVVDRTDAHAPSPEIRRPLAADVIVDADALDAELRSLLDPP